MRSTTQEKADVFDLERDLPLTAADIEALARARKRTPLDFEKYLRWLEEITAGRTRRREFIPPSSPFEL
jgi:hypothetical protein